jgi:sterol desaturase/sphingolipid hydroxylase (fatty acid hydroxylase superfamily)
MDDLTLTHAIAIRLAAYAAVLGLMIGWEWLAPRRRRVLTRAQRWPWNLGIAALNAGIGRALFAIAPLAAAAWAADHGIGLLPALDGLGIGLPAWAAIALCVVVFDLAIYGQHVAFHHHPLLWRLHRMHHADPDIDATTGARFHPIEIVLSAFYKSAIAIALGAPLVAIVIFEILLNATAMFNHANVRVPAAVDRWLRLIVVTPDMHRVHHSIHREETDSNFGFNWPWWDRAFGTYRAEPRDGHESMTIGLDRFRGPVDQRIDRLLIQPFIGDDPARQDSATPTRQRSTP